MLRLVGLWQEFQQAAIAVKRLGDIMNAPAEPYSHGAGARAAAMRRTIEIERIAFRYAEDLPLLYADLSLRLQPGRAASALMGPSGSGKSTLAQAAAGLLPADRRPIRLDGRDIRNLAANELRANFGVVPQETVLFSGTIYDNLILANPHAAFEEVVQACKHGRDPRRHRDAAAGLPDEARRARRRPVRRPEAARRHRARAAQAAARS